MIDFKGFKELDIRFSSSVIFTAILMPFWYVSLFLFKRDFIIKNSTIDVWIFCFCFATIWQILALMVSSVTHWDDEKAKESEQKRKEMHRIMFLNGGVFGILILCFVLMGCYVSNLYTPKKITHNLFLFIAFGFLMALWIQHHFAKALDAIFKYFGWVDKDPEKPKGD